MSREIKFRAWYKPDLELGNFMKFETVYSNDTVRFEWNDNSAKHPFTYDVATVLADNDWIKEQYTGLKDTNGVEIYEGDIVKVHDDWGTYGMMAGEVREVYFAYGGFRFKPKDNINAKGNWLDNGNYCVVIGNIHENKELLK